MILSCTSRSGLRCSEWCGIDGEILKSLKSHLKVTEKSETSLTNPDPSTNFILANYFDCIEIFVILLFYSLQAQGRPTLTFPLTFK